MPQTIYQRLARHLDELPAGFPSTADGAELRLLATLFTPDEAGLALRLTPLPEEARVVARRARLPVSVAAARLDDMVDKGLIDAFTRPGEPTRYLLAQFVVGFWEGQVNRLTLEAVEAFEAYIAVAGVQIWRNAPQLRTIPIGKTVDTRSEVMPYEQAEQIIGRHSRIAVMNCICRQEQRLLGHDCGKPLEACLVFGGFAAASERLGRARWIDAAEALQLLRAAEAAGLVLQPGNSQNPGGICLCCGCCCTVLRCLKTLDRPVDMAITAFRVQLNEAACAGCGVCEQRCPMDALYLGDAGISVLKAERCIGCGLCVSACPSGALALVRKPEVQQPAIPPNGFVARQQWSRARGQLTPLKLARIKVKSQIDRLLAPRR